MCSNLGSVGIAWTVYYGNSNDWVGAKMRKRQRKKNLKKRLYSILFGSMALYLASRLTLPNGEDVYEWREF